MAIDGIVIHKIIEGIQKELPLKINRITQASDHEYFIQGFNGHKKTIFLSVHPNFARLQLSEEKNSTNLDQSHFLMLLRKNMSGGIITKIKQHGFDRVIELVIEHRDEMGVIHDNRLIMELIGKSANLLLVSENNVILDAHKRVSSFENNARSIYSGAIYEYPEDFDKKSFDEIINYKYDEPLRQQYQGISPLLEREILHRLETQNIKEIYDEIMNSEDLYVYEKDFHVIRINEMKDKAKVMPIMDGLDFFYLSKQNQARIKSHTGDLLKLIKRELKRAKLKLPKLKDDLLKAEDSEYLREFGDLLFMYASDKKSGLKEISVQNFDGETLIIPLNEKFNGKENAKRYFKRYNKAKTSLSYIEAEIEKTENRIDYFERLELQCNQATVEDAKEIQEELTQQGIINQKKFKQSKHIKKKVPHYIVIDFDEKTKIYVGKNNLQNEAISFKIAQKNDVWFHVAHQAGAHVLLKTDCMDETKQRLCCQLAAYFSSSRYSSSVEVHYTLAKNIKKVPKGTPGLVQIHDYKSMFIDPDEEYLNTYLKQ